jgi:[ribosomal protein S18]-alanine N-acetyltransferase
MPLIRVGGPEDLAEIRAIQAASPEASQWDPSDYLRYDLRVAIEDEGRLSGFAVSRQTAADEIELLNLAVAPAFRRRGVARELVKSIVESHETGAAISVFLEVRESNLPARAFYKSLNFQEVTIRQNYYDQPLESAIVMKFHSC